MMLDTNVKYLLIMVVTNSLNAPNPEVIPHHGATIYEGMTIGIIAQIVLQVYD